MKNATGVDTYPRFSASVRNTGLSFTLVGVVFGGWGAAVAGVAVGTVTPGTGTGGAVAPGCGCTVPCGSERNTIFGFAGAGGGVVFSAPPLPRSTFTRLPTEEKMLRRLWVCSGVSR